MKKPAALAIIAWFFLPVGCTAQGPPLPEAPQRWVPFTATAHESKSWVHGVQATGSQFYELERIGVFARNESGADYLHWVNAGSPQTQFPDVAYLTDRAAGARWEIDYKLKNSRRTNLDLTGHPELSPGPMNWEVFLKSHAKDLSLGRKTLGGMDCVAYRIRSKREPKRFWKEVWFAPALNFFAIRVQYLSPNGKFTRAELANVRIEPPNPSLFHVPDGFSVVH